jgi:hypothetical protein
MPYKIEHIFRQPDLPDPHAFHQSCVDLGTSLKGIIRVYRGFVAESFLRFSRNASSVTSIFRSREELSDVLSHIWPHIWLTLMVLSAIYRDNEVDRQKSADWNLDLSSKLHNRD